MTWSRCFATKMPPFSDQKPSGSLRFDIGLTSGCHRVKKVSYKYSSLIAFRRNMAFCMPSYYLRFRFTQGALTFLHGFVSAP